jgi:hypothetical protein
MKVRTYKESLIVILRRASIFLERPGKIRVNIDGCLEEESNFDLAIINLRHRRLSQDVYLPLPGSETVI